MNRRQRNTSVPLVEKKPDPDTASDVSSDAMDHDAPLPSVDHTHWTRAAARNEKNNEPRGSATRTSSSDQELAISDLPLRCKHSITTMNDEASEPASSTTVTEGQNSHKRARKQSASMQEAPKPKLTFRGSKSGPILAKELPPPRIYVELDFNKELLRLEGLL